MFQNVCDSKLIPVIAYAYKLQTVTKQSDSWIQQWCGISWNLTGGNKNICVPTPLHDYRWKKMCLIRRNAWERRIAELLLMENGCFLYPDVLTEGVCRSGRRGREESLHSGLCVIIWWWVGDGCIKKELRLDNVCEQWEVLGLANNRINHSFSHGFVHSARG